MAEGGWRIAETQEEVWARAWDKELGKKHVRNEYERLERNPPDGCYVQAIDENSLHWQATVVGPPSSVYEGGVFHITLKYKDEDPFVWPEVTFITKIYHPLIVNENGKICERCLSTMPGADICIVSF
ncbi:ubiquitin-conjugating enzyme E2 D1-like [Sycon ciliatum]|uniref:ubiquitin-conjugating enzyme E2 D1-like n=1 Tax=Sycon ciliatum TaxID=27933 RepID=UPI0031F6A4A3